MVCYLLGPLLLRLPASVRGVAKVLCGRSTRCPRLHLFLGHGVKGSNPPELALRR
jgi:hypothetical protein